MLSTWLSGYQDGNPEKFNDGFVRVRGRTYESDLLDILNDACRTLSGVVEGVEYVRGEIFDSDEDIRLLLGDEHKDIEESSLLLVQLRFDLRVGDEEDTVLLRLLFPKLVDDFFFLLNGNRYVAVHQMVDKGTYTAGRNLTLKTLLLPVTYVREPGSWTFESGRTFSGNAALLSLFKKQTSPLAYFAARLGVPGALRFVGMADRVVWIGPDGKAPENGSWELLELSGGRWAVDASLLDDPLLSPCALPSVLGWLDGFSVGDPAELGIAAGKRMLGRLFTQDPERAAGKAEGILVSLGRILDPRTQKNLSHIAPEDKRDIHHVLRWMLVFHEDLRREDSMDLRGKRLRMTEYLTLPLVYRFSNAAYRHFNLKARNVRMLRTLFGNIGPEYCVKRIRVDRFLKYVSNVNPMDLFVAQKVTQSGEAGAWDDAGGGGSVSARLRGHHPSFLGRLGLFATSASDPGVTTTVSPFLEMAGDGWCFDDSVPRVSMIREDAARIERRARRDEAAAEEAA